MDSEPTLFVGVDWASTEHQVCALGPDGPSQRAFAHEAEGLGAMVDWLCSQAATPELVAVAIETPHGPVVEALMDRGVRVFSVNPKQLDRFRDRFSPAGAKDDRRDALVLASSLKTDRHCFRPLEPLDPVIVELREWSRMADELKCERTRLTNRIRQQLWRYYPQALELGDDVGVGDVKDYTGKYSINEGNAITQGGALMVYSALGKLGGAVAVAERFDPSVAERELGYIDRRQLGDGEEHRLSGANGVQDVPWLPYFGGTIQKSDYFIVGGITEVNYNIASGGGEIGVNQVGAKRRTYNESVSIDLRIVNTKTLMVEKTVSLTKQFTGYEVDANIFRFFGSNLWDVDIGAKGQEPLQLGIRTAMEEGVVRLVSAVTHVDYRPCMDQLTGRVLAKPAETMRQRANPAAKASSQADAKAERPVNAAMNTVGRIPGGGVQIAFEFGSADLDGRALTILDQIAAQAKKGGAEVMLVSHDTENLDPGKRDTLLNQRIAAVTAALTSRGVAAGAVQVVWRPDPADTAIHRDGPGMQELAKLKIGG